MIITEPNHTLWEKLYLRITQEGLWKGIWAGFKFLIRKIFGISWESELIMRRSMDVPIRAIEPKINVFIRQAFKQDLPLLRKIVEDEKYATFLERFGDQDNSCFLALSDGRIIGYCWMAIKQQHSYKDHPIILNNENLVAFFYDIEILPEYRNFGIMKALSAFRFKRCKEAGCTSVISAISSSNKPSLKSAKGSGFIPIMSLATFTICWHQFAHLKKYK